VKHQRRLMVAAMTLPVLALAACGGGGDEETAAGGGGGACEASDGEVTLNFVTWVPGMDQVVEMWNEENPDVQVEVETTPAGNAGTYNNLFNGLEADTAPDLSQIEYDSLSSFRLQDGLQDISACEGVSDASGDFVDWTWSQVQLGDEGVYAIPQDTGPMALFYREDLFTQAGITEPPATWEEYYQAAVQLKQATGAYITHFPQGDANWFTGLLWQREPLRARRRPGAGQRRQPRGAGGGGLLAADDRRGPRRDQPAGLLPGPLRGLERRSGGQLAVGGLGLLDHPRQRGRHRRSLAGRPDAAVERG
jgi:multiple sugar transport system substrate-binding protein